MYFRISFFEKQLSQAAFENQHYYTSLLKKRSRYFGAARYLQTIFSRKPLMTMGL